MSLELKAGPSDGVKPVASVEAISGRAASSHSSPSIVNFMLVRCLVAGSESDCGVSPGIIADAGPARGMYVFP